MLRLLIGGLAGVIAAYFLDPDLGRHRRQKALSKFEKTTDVFSDLQIEDKQQQARPMANA